MMPGMSSLNLRRAMRSMLVIGATASAGPPSKASCDHGRDRAPLASSPGTTQPPWPSPCLPVPAGGTGATAAREPCPIRSRTARRQAIAGSAGAPVEVAQRPFEQRLVGWSSFASR